MMHYTYDIYGRFDGTSPTATDRSTMLAPPDLSPDYNWSGDAWVYAPGIKTSPMIGGSAPAPATRITKLAFRNRFTQAEKVAIEIAQLDVAAASMPQRSMAAALRANQADLQVATFIDLSRPDTRAGVQSLEAAGILAAGRALAILDAPATHDEKPL